MKFKIQKRLSARVLKSSKKKIWFDSNRLEEIKEAITKADIRSLIKDKAIKAKKTRGISRYRTRRVQEQKSKGRFLKNLRDKNVIDKSSYRSLYMKSKGNFFRSKRHLKMYLDEQGIIKNEK